MSEQSQIVTTTTYEQARLDDSEPTDERKAELRTTYDENVKTGKEPYEGVRIRTRGELRWIMQERNWSGEVTDAEEGRRANLSRASLRGVNLESQPLNGADCGEAHFDRANLYGSFLRGAQLQGTHFDHADLRSADLRGARMNTFTDLRVVRLDRGTMLAEVVWNGVPLTSIDWKSIPVLGDETVARRPQMPDGTKKRRSERLADYEAAVRANRLLATTLRAQGLNEEADRYFYRAQLLQRIVLRRQRTYLRYFGSLLLGIISGYGYRPIRSVLTYIIVILSFAAAYFALTNFAITPFLPSHSSSLPWYEALVLSISSFHGRGLFPTGLSLGDPVAIVAAFEAIIGLLIEITFIATFTQRFFAR